LGANAIDRFLRSGVLAAALLAGPAGGRANVVAENPNHGIGDGETLTYTVRWGIIPSVGRITISAAAIGSGSDAVLRVTTTTATTGLARGLFRFDGRGESVYQASSGQLLSSSEWSSYRDKVVKNSVTFNYATRMATFTDDINPKNSRQIRMPPGDPADLILALIATRNWVIPPGGFRDALVIFQDQFFPLTIRPEPEQELVFTSLGIFKATVLVPRMEKSPPIGMFKRGSTVRVWIADEDARHLPVRFEVGFRFGTGTATLLDYHGPK